MTARHPETPPAGRPFVVERDGDAWSVYRRKGDGRERVSLGTFAYFTQAMRFVGEIRADGRADAIRKAAMGSAESEKP